MLVVMAAGCAVSPYWNCDTYTDGCYYGVEGRLNQDIYIGPGMLEQWEPPVTTSTTMTPTKKRRLRRQQRIERIERREPKQ